MKRYNYSIICLCFVLSVGRSFQLQQWNPNFSTSSSTTATNSKLQNKDRANTSLQVSTAISTRTGTGSNDHHLQVLQDWANKIAAPIHPSSSTARRTSINRRKKLSSSSSSSKPSSSSATNVYEPAKTIASTPSSTTTASTTATKDLYYEHAKEEWANRYTNLDSLRATFGSNRNKVWGDLDAPTARRLYKTLLPKALLELVKVDGIQPEDLAPLAYQARVAAKLYARERCQVPCRVFCQLFDGFRQFKKYGKFQPSGMSYDQIFEKYYDQIILEEETYHHQHHQQQQHRGEGDSASSSVPDSVDGLTEQDVTAKICLKILERSCVSNENVDKWVLPPPNTQEERDDLMKITQTLENDVRKLLDPALHQHKKQSQSVLSIRKYRILRLIAKAKQRRRRNHQHRNSMINSDANNSSSRI